MYGILLRITASTKRAKSVCDVRSSVRSSFVSVTVSSSGVPIDISNGVPGSARAARMAARKGRHSSKSSRNWATSRFSVEFSLARASNWSKPELLIRVEDESRWLSWKVETMRGETVRRETRGLCGRLQKAASRRDAQANLLPKRLSSENLHRANLLGSQAPDGDVARSDASGESV